MTTYVHNMGLTNRNLGNIPCIKWSLSLPSSTEISQIPVEY